jgi:hypothetical protein
LRLRVPRQQQRETTHHQSDPQEIQCAARAEQRDRERSEKLQRHRNAQRNGAQCHVEAKVHDAQGEAVAPHRSPVLPTRKAPPRLAQQPQDQRAQSQTHGSGALRTDQREELLGQRCTALERKHAEQQRADRQQG